MRDPSYGWYDEQLTLIDKHILFSIRISQTIYKITQYQYFRGRACLWLISHISKYSLCHQICLHASRQTHILNTFYNSYCVYMRSTVDLFNLNCIKWHAKSSLRATENKIAQNYLIQIGLFTFPMIFRGLNFIFGLFIYFTENNFFSQILLLDL